MEVFIDKEEVLASAESFIAFLRSRFDDEHIDVELETEAYSFVIDPPSMKKQIVTHLRYMWETHLTDEWARVKPMLRDSVTAFDLVDIDQMSNLEAARFVTGQNLDGEHWTRMLQKAEQVIFVPSAHVGPYLGKFWFGKTLGIIFGARLPKGSQIHAPDLSRAEILVRLSALADDTRLRILKFIVDHGEQRSQEIIQKLDLSQSAASRHLTQLNATGYLTARRCEGAKCYQISSTKVQDTLNAVQAFLNNS
jgi:DNA-binding transcriptional ArsR family regulator